MKIAFDFDGTLEFKNIQKIAKKLIKEGNEVWIVTSRYDLDNQYNYVLNGMKEKYLRKKVKQLNKIKEKLSIPVHYTNMNWKGSFLEENNFDLLYDDNQIEEDHLKKM